MDLRTFAVHQKLASDSKLLDYVTKNQAVPLEVVEQAFSDFYEPLVDAKATALMENYPKMLVETVPVIMTPSIENPGGYDITGEIPDSLMDAIALIHDTDADTIIKAFMNYHFEAVRGETCHFLETTKTEEEVRSQLQTPLTVNPAYLQMAAKESVVTKEEEVPEMPEMEEISEAVEPEEVPEMPEMEVPEEEISEMEEEVPEEVSEEEIEEASEEKVLIEETSEENVSEDEAAYQQMISAMQRIYVKFVKDIRQYNLDEALNLQVA